MKKQTICYFNFHSVILHIEPFSLAEKLFVSINSTNLIKEILNDDREELTIKEII